VAVAAPACGAAEQGAAEQSGVGWRLGLEGAGGFSVGLKGRGARDLGRARSRRKPARSRAGIAASVACARRGEGDDPVEWVRAVSEKGRALRGRWQAGVALACGPGSTAAEAGTRGLREQPCVRAGESGRGLVRVEERSGPRAWAAREGRAGRWAAGKGLGRVFWVFFFSISIHSLSTPKLSEFK
jgi:hypothetical protein